jgi:hypothetical protein
LYFGQLQYICMSCVLARQYNGLFLSITALSGSRNMYDIGYIYVGFVVLCIVIMQYNALAEGRFLGTTGNRDNPCRLEE